jgi:competence protein ComEC
MQLDFYKRPFLHVCIPFIIGLFLVFATSSVVSPLILLGVVLLGAIFFLRQVTTNFGVFQYGTVYFLGFVLGCFVGSLYEEFNPKFQHSGYVKGDLVQLEITEINQGSGDWNKAIGRVHTIFTQKGSVNGKNHVLLYINKDASYIQKGDILLVGAEFTPIENKNNPGEFNAEYYWNSRGIDVTAFATKDEISWINEQKPSLFDQFLNGFSSYLQSALHENLSGNDLAIAQALILGDKSLLDTETKNAFTNTGAMHILAVSGMHVGLIMYLFITVFGFFPRFITKKQATWVVVIFLWIYALITGFSASVVRAVLMFTFVALSQVSAKQYDSLNSLFLSAFILLVLNPLYLMDIGFQLSYLAMVGIFLFYQKIEGLLHFRHARLRELWQGTALGFAAQLMTTGISLYYFHQFPNYFVLTNLGLMFFSAIVMGLGFLLFVVKWIPVLSKFVGIILGFSVYLMYWIVQQIDGLPGAVAYGFSVPFWLVLLMMILFIYLILYAKKRKQLLVGYSLYFLSVLYIVYERNAALTKSELCVFNHNQLVIALKYKNQIHCFYKSKPEQVAKIHLLMESYSKLYPGVIHYHAITKKAIQFSFGDQDFQLNDAGETVNMKWNQKRFDILYKQESSQNTAIYMPWIQDGSGVLLKNGALLLGAKL